MLEGSEPSDDDSVMSEHEEKHMKLWSGPKKNKDEWLRELGQVPESLSGEKKAKMMNVEDAFESTALVPITRDKPPCPICDIKLAHKTQTLRCGCEFHKICL